MSERQKLLEDIQELENNKINIHIYRFFLLYRRLNILMLIALMLIAFLGF